MPQSNSPAAAPCKTVAKLRHLRTVVTFSTYPDPKCTVDYCVDGFASDPDVLVFASEYFPRIEYISDAMIARHY